MIRKNKNKSRKIIKAFILIEEGLRAWNKRNNNRKIRHKKGKAVLAQNSVLKKALKT
jgi:hypothetical protein